MLARQYTPPPPETLRFLRVETTFAVVSKPSGLLSVPGRGPDKAICAQSYARDALGEALTVHRLDMDTSGLMVFARTPQAQRALSIQFQERLVGKGYEAVVSGRPDIECGTIDLPIASFSLARPLRHIAEDGQTALTHWKVISHAHRTSRLSLRPETGRSHQLRLHLSSIGHPILGDPLYGSPGSAGRLMLHATSLDLLHPETGEPVSVQDVAPF